MIRRLLFIAAFFGYVGTLGADEEATIQWRTDYASARKEAEKSQLPLMLDFGSADCFWCKKLDDTTLRDPRIVEILKSKFIPLKVDGNRDINLTNALRISSYPTLVFAGPDGRILGTLEGFQEPSPLLNQLEKTLVSLSPSESTSKELQLAEKWFENGDHVRAYAALKLLSEESKAPAVQTKARKLLEAVETKAQEKVKAADSLVKAGKNTEAVEILSETIRSYAGTDSAKKAAETLVALAKTQGPVIRNEQRLKKAQELLVQAKSFYKSKDYIPCLDRCEILLQGFGDLEEGQEAQKLAGEIRANPEWMQSAADTLGDRLGGIYLSLAESLLKRGQPERANFYLQRVVAAFPGSRQAESAQIRIGQIQALMPRRDMNEKSAANPEP